MSPTPSALYHETVEPLKRKCFSFRNLQFEAVRLSTFYHWPNDHFILPKKLAENGFYSINDDDLVQCYYCRQRIGFWEKGDVPALEHKKYSPRCPLITGNAVTNIPIDESPVNTFLNSFIEAKMDEPLPPKPKQSYETDAVIVNMSGPATDVFPAYNRYEKRLATFKIRTKNMPNNEKLANAGFFSSNVSDMTQCYACGGCVYNWNPDEEPTTVHDKLYPLCRLSKERTAGSTPVGHFNSRKITKAEKEHLLELPVAKKLVEFGINPDLVKEALAYELDEFGTLPINVQAAFETLEEFNDIKSAVR